MSLNNTPDSQSLPRKPLDFLRLIIKGIFIVPKTQVKLLDFPYLLYTFNLFHRKKLNRISHYIGIPMTMMTLYAILSQWSFAAEALLVFVAVLHLGMAGKHRLRSLIPLILIFHLGFWLAGKLLMPGLFDLNEAWFTNPYIHLVFWPFLQYITHSLEPFIPFPWSLDGQWTSLKDFYKGASFLRLALLFLCLPWHVFVEFISGHKNLFLVYFFLGQQLRIPMSRFESTEQKIKRELAKEDPIIIYEEFELAMAN